MRLTIQRLVLIIPLVAFIISYGACSSTETEGDGSSGGGGSSDGGTADDTTGIGTIDNNVSAMANIPRSDPLALDYALVEDVESGLVKSLVGRNQVEGGGSSLRVKITHTAGEGLGTFKIFQCEGSEGDWTHTGYASYTVVDDVYTQTVVYDSGENGYNMEITGTVTAGLAITDENFSGNITLHANEASAVISAGDSVTTLQGAYTGQGSMTCKWGADLGCATVENESGNNITTSYAITSVDVDTGEKTYGESSDTANCSDHELITADSVAEFPETWDCDTEGETVVSIDSAADLEDAGGDMCDQEEFWGEHSTGPDECGNPAESGSVVCYCDAVEAIAYQQIDITQRMLACKIKGAFNLIEDGTISASLEDNSSLFLEIAGIGGEGGPGGDDGGPPPGGDEGDYTHNLSGCGMLEGSQVSVSQLANNYSFGLGDEATIAWTYDGSTCVDPIQIIPPPGPGTLPCTSCSVADNGGVVTLVGCYGEGAQCSTPLVLDPI